jgi:ferritin-like metal-binding protein YciE
MSQQEAIRQLITALTTLAESLSAMNLESVSAEEESTQTQTLTLEDVRAVLADISRTGKREAIQQLLADFGVQKLSELDCSRYPALLQAAEAIR